MRVIDALIFIV